MKSDVEGAFFSLLDLQNNPDKYLIFELDQPMKCRKCDKPLTIKKKKNYISFLCGCGCRVFYPVNKKGEIVPSWISGVDYFYGKRKQ